MQASMHACMHAPLYLSVLLLVFILLLDADVSFGLRTWLECHPEHAGGAPVMPSDNERQAIGGCSYPTPLSQKEVEEEGVRITDEKRQHV